MWTSDVRYLQARSNVVADALSRPSDVPVGTAYDVGTEAAGDALVESQEMEQMFHQPTTNGAKISTIINGISPSSAGPNFEMVRQNPVDAVALSIVDHTKLAADQNSCPDVRDHKAGKHDPSLKMENFEFSPGLHIYCDVSNHKKARPLVPKPHRDLIVRWFHDIAHPGPAETLRKVGARYYWPSIRKDVAEFVSRCHGCNSSKATRIIRPPPGPQAHHDAPLQGPPDRRRRPHGGVPGPPLLTDDPR